MPGVAILRNPGVSLVWTTKTYRLFRAEGGLLVQMGEPTAITVWSEGKPASWESLKASIETGLPSVEALCGGDPEALRELVLATATFYSLLKELWRIKNE